MGCLFNFLIVFINNFDRSDKKGYFHVIEIPNL